MVFIWFVFGFAFVFLGSARQLVGRQRCSAEDRHTRRGIKIYAGNATRMMIVRKKVSSKQSLIVLNAQRQKGAREPGTFT